MKALVCDNSDISALIRNILRDAELLASKPESGVTIEPNDDGWYRQFEKKSKKRNLKLNKGNR